MYTVINKLHYDSLSIHTSISIDYYKSSTLKVALETLVIRQLELKKSHISMNSRGKESTNLYLHASVRCLLRCIDAGTMISPRDNLPFILSIHFTQKLFIHILHQRLLSISHSPRNSYVPKSMEAEAPFHIPLSKEQLRT